MTEILTIFTLNFGVTSGSASGRPRVTSRSGRRRGHGRSSSARVAGLYSSVCRVKHTALRHPHTSRARTIQLYSDYTLRTCQRDAVTVPHATHVVRALLRCYAHARTAKATRAPPCSASIVSAQRRGSEPSSRQPTPRALEPRRRQGENSCAWQRAPVEKGRMHWHK